MSRQAVFVRTVAALSLGVLLASQGCVWRWGAATEHRPAVEQELEPDRKRSNHPATWSPDPRLVERGILESMSGGLAPRDDSPSWRGPSHTAGSYATGERPGVNTLSEWRSRRQELDERVAKRIEEENAKPGPADFRGDRAPKPATHEGTLEAWEQWKADRGFQPIDLDPNPTPPPAPRERKGQ